MGLVWIRIRCWQLALTWLSNSATLPCLGGCCAGVLLP